MPDLITPDMKLTEVIKKFPEIFQIFQKYNLHCLGCLLAVGESLKDGLTAHGLDADKVIGEMNKLISKEK